MTKVLYIIPTFERTKAIQPVLRSIEQAGYPIDVFVMIKQSTPETRKRYDDVLSGFHPNGNLTIVEHENVGYDFIAWRTAINQFRGQYDDYVFGVDECYFADDDWLVRWYQQLRDRHDMLVWSSYERKEYFPNIRNIRPPYIMTDALLCDARNYDVPASMTSSKNDNVNNAEMPWLYSLDAFCAKTPFRVTDAKTLGIAIGGMEIQYSGYDDGRVTE